MKTVFVYADGKVGLVELPQSAEKASSWRVPRSRPLSLKPYEDVTGTSMTVDDYRRRGVMFDGSPIFCADGFEVIEAQMTMLVSPRELTVQLADDRLQREVQRFIEREYPSRKPIHLDAWIGEVPLSVAEKAEGLERQHLAKRRARLLVAVWP